MVVKACTFGQWAAL